MFFDGIPGNWIGVGEEAFSVSWQLIAGDLEQNVLEQHYNHLEQVIIVYKSFRNLF